MLIPPSDLSPGENPTGLGTISRPFSLQLKAEDTSILGRLKEAYYYRSVAEVLWEVVGVDVSVWQGKMNWEIAAKSIDYAILRAGHGTAGDTQLDNNRVGCGLHKVPFGLYWYLQPSFDWRGQARTYAQVYLDSPGKLTPTMDVEETGGLSRSAMASWTRSCLEEFEARTNVRPMIYTSQSFWNSYIGNPAWANKYKLWVANYTSATKPAMPASWVKWTLWQWSSKGKGSAFGAQSTFIDLDRYWGTMAQFKDEFKVDINHDIYIPVVINMKVLDTSTPYLNVRKTPTTAGSVVGQLRPGDLFDASNFGGASAWALITGGTFDGNWVCVEMNGKRYCDIVPQIAPQ